MRTQEFINKVFVLDIIPKDCYFEITRENLVLGFINEIKK